ncbi:MAG: sugar ABC transporter permease [Caldilineaceae bacterium]|nr:sugar ABC transporter permease [Caldilineaceae bacterium]MCB0071746.1 sugar ABC transporter permease [Caldilineaceae bacterium]MCB9162511.1 sugar ABC transporter permease [Caldilineaceae bacterium]
MSQATISTEQALPTTPTRSRRRTRLGALLEGLLYLAPTLIGLALFIYWPIVESFRLSLNRVAPFGNRMRFVGFENYRTLLTDPEYWQSVRVTFWFVLGTVPVGIALAVLLAILLSYPLRHLSWLHRTLIFVPIVISSAITGVLFRWLYHPVVGYLNYWMVQIGIFDSMKDAPNWLSDKTWALVAVIIATTWRQLGFNVIIALAGVQNIDESFYDAAKVDGANSWQRIRHVTLPLLSPTLFFLLIINVIYSFQAFGEIDILTLGGPGRATTTMVYSIYVDAFVGTPMRGIASAQAYILAIVVIVMSFLQFATVSRRVHYQ